MDIRPVGAALFHADWRYEVNSRLSQFCERSYKWKVEIDGGAVKFVQNFGR